MIYHYTNLDAFLGIIDNPKSLRMTRSEFFSDPFDCRLFYSLAEKYLNSTSVQVNTFASGLSWSSQILNIYQNQNCDLIHYIEYIFRKIPIYVLSFSNIDDDLNMWSRFRSGGIELAFDENKLLDALRSVLNSDDEYLCSENVFYLDKTANFSGLTIPMTGSFKLSNKSSSNIFSNHRFILNSKSGVNSNLYLINKADDFMNTLLKDYLNTLNYLFDREWSDSGIPTTHVVFDKVHENTLGAYDKMIWKHDLPLYMMVLSGLLKNKAYNYENEKRIIYFRYDVTNGRNNRERYVRKTNMSIDFLRPYASFENLDLSSALNFVRISPITRNLPIDSDTYIENIHNALDYYGLNGTNVCVSNHEIRW